MNTQKNIKQLKSAIKSKEECRKIKSDNIVFFFLQVLCWFHADFYILINILKNCYRSFISIQVIPHKTNAVDPWTMQGVAGAGGGVFTAALHSQKSTNKFWNSSPHLMWFLCIHNSTSMDPANCGLSYCSIYYWKKSALSGPMQFKPVIWTLNPYSSRVSCIFHKHSVRST